MPIPFLFIGAGVGSAIAGVGKAVKASKDNSRAKRINESANEKVERAASQLDRPRRQCGEALEYLGAEKVYILNNSIREFLYLFKFLKNTEVIEWQKLNDFNGFCVDGKVIDELKEMEDFASSLVGGAAAGVAGGALMAFGAYNAAATFATASTGTAIASLSGAAAKSATLAFFGGGSLAVEGLGIAGGTAVLGGLLAGPALLVMGLVTGAKASKNLDNAYANEAKAKEICEQLETAAQQCNAIRRRIYMFYCLLARLDTYFLPLLGRLKTVIEEEGIDYSTFTSEGQQTVAAAASIAATIKAVLDTPILTEDGNLTSESEAVINDVINVLDEEEKKE